jgi:hypothetical protein
MPPKRGEAMKTPFEVENTSESADAVNFPNAEEIHPATRIKPCV